jgi:hypothetical protein
MHNSSETKHRGQTPGLAHLFVPHPTHPNLEQTLRANANRSVKAGVAHRGDRRDTSRPFTNNQRHQPNLSDPLGSGKKQIQAGGKSRKGGGKRQKGTYDH